MHRFGVQIAGCVVLFVCSETPHLPRLHPFTAGPRALDRNRGESVTAEEERTDGWRDEVVLTVLHSVVNHCGLQGCSSHGCTGDGLSRCEHSLAVLTVKSPPVFFTQMTSLRWEPFPHAALHCSETEGVYTAEVRLLCACLKS